MDYRELLQGKLFPFWIEHAVDRECGGIFTSVDKNGEVVSTDKHMWITCRAMWTFATAYRVIEPRPEYLEMCRHIYAFLEKCTLPGGRLPFIASREGGCVAEKNNCYSESYAAMACAQYYRSCKDPKVLESARMYFDFVEKHYHQVCADYARSGDPAQEPKFGLHLIMFFTAQFMRPLGIDVSGYEAFAQVTADHMVGGGYLREDLGFLPEYRTKEGEKPDARAEEVCPGNAFAAAWFLLIEAELKQDARLRAAAKRFMDLGLRWHTGKNPGMIPLIYNINDPQGKITYSHWAHWEATVAYRLAENIWKDGSYQALAEETERVLLTHFMDQEQGLFYISVDESLQHIENSGRHGDLFHVPRALMALTVLSENKSILPIFG